MFAHVKGLFKSFAIYGLGDVATSLVSLLLLPVYTRYLSPSDYGIIAMLLTIEAIAKIVFRWGVDTAFMRLYYDCADVEARRRLASTIFVFLLVMNGALLAAALASSGWLSVRLFGTAEHRLLIALMLVNTFVVSFYFIPLQVLRIGGRSGQFIALVFSRSAGTLITRLVLVVGAEMGVLGVVTADVVVTVVFTAVLTPWFVPLIRPMFSTAVIREALGFGLPRIPHSLAQQVISVADRYFLNALGTLRDVGLYSIGASFGLGLKLFLSAFEYAWTPFFLGTMHEPDARRIYSTVSTYVLAALVLLVAGLCAVARDLVRLATTSEFHAAAAVTPWIALGVMFQGIYLLGSIGLIITRRTSRYPLATGLAAVTGLSANAVLIPAYGFLGAAWANAIAYGTLAVVTVGFSLRVYPIQYEWTRILRIVLGGVVAFLAGREASDMVVSPAAGLLLAGLVTAGTYLAVLSVSGFFHRGELRLLEDFRRRALRNSPPGAAAPPDGNEVEMAGELLSAAPQPDAASMGTPEPPGNEVSSRASRR